MVNVCRREIYLLPNFLRIDKESDKILEIIFFFVLLNQNDNDPIARNSENILMTFLDVVLVNCVEKREAVMVLRKLLFCSKLFGECAQLKLKNLCIEK
jgi:hypothetical protein